MSSIFHSLLAPTKRDVDFFFITARFSPAAPGLEEEVLDPHELMGSFLWSPGQSESLWIADKRALNHWDVFWDVASGYDIHRASHGINHDGPNRNRWFAHRFYGRMADLSMAIAVSES